MKFMPYKILSVVLMSLMIGGEPVKGMGARITDEVVDTGDDVVDATAAVENAAEHGGGAQTAAERATQDQWIGEAEAGKNAADNQFANEIKAAETAVKNRYGTGPLALSKITTSFANVFSYPTGELRDEQILKYLHATALTKVGPASIIQKVKQIQYFTSKMSWWKGLSEWEKKEINTFIEDGEGRLFFTSKNGGKLIPEVE